MNSVVVIREGRILLEEPAHSPLSLSLKLCVGRQIFKFHGLQWSETCRRWELKEEMRLPWQSGLSIELEIFHQRQGAPPLVIGEGIIDMNIVCRHLLEELKISLTYDGLVVGWLYCQVSMDGQQQKTVESKFLYIHKINLVFLQDQDEEIQLKILQNTEPIFEKAFTISPKTKTIYPNIKKPVRYSDVILISILHPEQGIKPISFLVDHIKRGKTSFFESWLRNKHKNKCGDISIEYFLQNLYSENDRKIFSRKAIIPHSIEPARPKQPIKQKIKQKTRRSVIIQKIQEADKRILKMNTNLNRLLEEVKINERAIPCLKKSRSNLRCAKPEKNEQRRNSKQKLSFYFEGKPQ